MKNFYSPFIHSGDLCFDLGAHVGNRTAVWRELGARVVAVEPQPRCVAELQSRFADDPMVTLLDIGMSSHPGEATLYINPASPTISTLRKQDWQSHIAQFSSRRETWDEQVTIQTRTLDELIVKFGLPVFCKIDVEGSELDVLRGLHHLVPHLSVEFFSQDLESAWALLDRLDELGTYTYNYSLREQHRMQMADYQPREDLVMALAGLADQVISGDIYALWQPR